MLVSDAIRQKIPSFGAHFSVYLRFKDMRNYSRVQVLDPQGILYVPLPDSGSLESVSELPPLDPELLALLEQKLADLFAFSALSPAI